jgi:DNA gyrase inhibitor GyrI
MSKLDVKITKLEPMRMASFHAYGASPELEAARKLADWAQPKGLLDARGTHRIFGFNNPDPSPGSPNYGYEFWIEIDPDLKVEKGVNVKDFPGGLYGVTRVNGVENITPAWQKLAAWRAESNYKTVNHQWLEEHTGPRPFTVTDKNLEMNLYIPIKE